MYLSIFPTSNNNQSSQNVTEWAWPTVLYKNEDFKGGKKQPLFQAGWQQLSGKVGCSIPSYWVNRRCAPWARAFTSTAPARNTIQAQACRQLWPRINKTTSAYLRVFPPLFPLVGVVGCDWDVANGSVEPDVEDLVQQKSESLVLLHSLQFCNVSVVWDAYETSWIRWHACD